ncbi:MAG: arginine repressor [Clostridia bacterium]|nr:arginine repressor [Clostridia bacterium]
MKNNRHAKILEIIKNNEIKTQEELLDHLKNAGFNVTQATISRDIKELRLVKVLSADGVYSYSVSNMQMTDMASKFYQLFADSVVSVDWAQNIVVVKCYSGMAQAVCAALDSMKWSGIVGTLAGDDTMFIVSYSEQSAKNLVAEMKKIIKVG